MIDWIATNIDLIFEIIGIIGVVCSGIVKIFSGKSWAKWLVKICDYCSFINTEEHKEAIKKYTEIVAKKSKK